ncbi:MAG: L-seryl-tRNA(Sec) selenium transferase [Acidobacteria bacterium]|nr:L-seryl-tRNA(Sec) selenium transferase [Acidobacteriota bacterium]
MSLYRKLPSVAELLQQDEFQLLLNKYPRTMVLQQTQQCLADLRSAIQSGLDKSNLEARLAQLANTVGEGLQKRVTPTLMKVINATGVVIHTNLGRAPIASGAIDFLRDIATGYCNLEYDLESGRRSHREKHLEPLFEQITGHKVSLAVVNNNAAAVLLMLETFASEGEVIVSRGELVEIGGSFRIPEILEKSGAKLREVGTTNKTRIEDYARAVNERTRLILRVHPSNFHIVGFTERPALTELSQLARQHRLPLIEDLGSGLIADAADLLRHEPTVRQSLDAGVDLVCFSGDKLLGATQAGIILGKPEWIQPLRANPLMRPLRVDKIGYAVLVYSLQRYVTGEAEKLPVQHLLTLPAAMIRQRSVNLMHQLQDGVVELRESFSLVGGGSAPDARIPTFVLAIKTRHGSAEDVHRFLRRQPPPIVARIEGDCIVFDLRTVRPEEDIVIAGALNRFFAVYSQRA